MTKKNITFSDLPQEGASLKKILDQALDAFEKNMLGQYRLSIPKGVVNKIDDIRDNEFSYLKDSLYKSNISYLVQQVNFQLWIYKLFGFKYSLENSFFYSLKLLLGIMVETLLSAILYNPLIQEESDRSLGDVSAGYQDIQKAIETMSFHDVISLADDIQALPNTYVDALHNIRRLRNEVHLQGKRERIYNNIDFDKFKQEYDLIRKTLFSLHNTFQKKPIAHTADDLRRSLFQYTGDTKTFFEGRIEVLKRSESFGYLRPRVEEYPAKAGVYFLLPAFDGGKSFALRKNQNVRFTFELTSGGLTAKIHAPLT